MKLRTLLAAAAVAALPGLAWGQAKPAAASVAASPQKPLEKKWTGDLDGMRKRRVIRVLVVYNRTHYFFDRGAQHGVSYDFGRAFEDALNTKWKTGNLRVHLVFIPVSRDDLLPALVEGRGDIAAANLTVTPERQKLVDFSAAGLKDVKEIVVSGPRSPAVQGLDDLGGKEVFVRKTSSYYASLLGLNASLQKRGKPAVILKPAPETLEDEDLLEMLNAGLVKFVVVDDHIAELWAQVLKKLVLHPDLAVRTNGEIAAAIRKSSPKLKAELDAFVKTHGQQTLFGNVTFKKYLSSTRYVKDAANEAEMKKFESLIELFRKYGAQYRLDSLLMAAQGYQESRLDQNAKSRVGAIGVMQVMPATAKDLKVGDVKQLEPNVHAGVKYVRFMIDHYFKDEPMDDLNKGLFAFASYNAGPGRIRSLRRMAKTQGLDPNVWFNNVERVAAAQIGRETVQYVSNIYKYYIAYQLAMQENEQRQKDRDALRPGLK